MSATNDGQALTKGQPETQAPTNGDQLPARSAPEPETRESALARGWDATQNFVRTNVPADYEHRRAFISKLSEKADQALEDIIGATFSVRAYYASVIELPDQQTGELIPKIRLCMLLDDGSTVDTTSFPFAKCFATIANMAPSTWWNPPIKLKTKKSPAKGQGHYFTCSEVMPDLTGISISDGKGKKK